MAEHQPKVYRVREAFSFDYNGRAYSMRTGDLVGPEHPSFKGREGLFEEVTDQTTMHDVASSPTAVIETATANPGERRSVRTPKGA